ncbi:MULTISPECIES: GntR family transcriptional regulator [unclassified Bordetella]|uniref:GntR family transcriptional regulator n=1 Tax=unclassified Bordetella TaxID=2630031 RepID=UPI00132295F3|nr:MULTISPECIES: GntR family transcriptional regulator [unclassified Bordetella]MVW70710.1 FCD domain-containing protein [Bordetella sp. 15P40C-2]MVW77584.1 FCD domain-containing protein [Bordetella sp. 02P26C-1]
MKPLREKMDHAYIAPLQQRASLSEDIYEALVTLLISLQVQPGERLSVDALARQFGVSQTPIRAALIRLETEGLVVKKHNSGYSAAPLPSGEHFRDVYAIRLLLEPEAAYWAAQKITKSGLKQLKDLCDKMAGLVGEDTHSNYGRFALLDGQFHALIASFSGNKVLADTLHGFYAHMNLFRLRYHSTVAEEAIKEHLAILDAIRLGDAQAAKSAMVVHISSSRDRMEPYFKMPS